MKIRVVSVSGGKDSTACALLCAERHPESEIRRIFCDVGNEHPLTYEYLDYLEDKLGPIVRLKADFTDAIAAKRQRLQRIANGEETDKFGKYRWTPETAAEALQYLVPTGNPFLDLCLSRGMFPSHGRQFCTEEQGQGIWQRVEWSKTARGGRQYDMFRIDTDASACSSAYGLCE